VLRSGTVRVERNHQHVVTLGEGVVLGELAVLGTDKRRTATVVCTSVCIMRALHGNVVNQILEGFPSAKLHFEHEYFSRRLVNDCSACKEERDSMDMFYGSPMPLTTAAVQKMLGLSETVHQVKKAQKKKAVHSAAAAALLQPLVVKADPARRRELLSYAWDSHRGQAQPAAFSAKERRCATPSTQPPSGRTTAMSFH